MAAPGVGNQPAAPHPSRRALYTWERFAGGLGALAAVVAFVVTVRADFLAYPGWLALQKADLIAGPIAVGLYWRHVRPQSRFGPMLVGLGILQIPYIAQSSSNDVLFTFGVHWEGVIYLATLAVILAFPTGRLGPFDRAILVVAALGVVVPSSAITLISPEIFAGGSISSCASACPDNALVLGSEPVLANRLFEIGRAHV